MRKLLKKNIFLIKRYLILYGEVLLVFLILLGNMFRNETDRIVFLYTGVFLSVTRFLMPIFMIILFLKIYCEDIGEGHIKVDILLGYKRNEILGSKLCMGSFISIMMFIVPYFLLYAFLYMFQFDYAIIADYFTSDEIGKAINACINYILCCVYFNSFFLTTYLLIKKAFRHKLIYSICEIIISVIEVFQWLNITMNVDKVIFSICLVIFQLILNVRVFRMIDL